MNSKGARILWDLTVYKRKCIVQLCNLFPVPGLYSNFLFNEIFSRMSAIYHSHTNVSQTCKLVRFRHYYRFFQSGWSTLLYNVFARGCIYHVYPIACFCMYIYLTCILIKDMKWLSPLFIRCRYCDLFFSLKETFLEFWKY